MAKAEDILNQLFGENVTMINNIKYNNNITTQSSSKENDGVEDLTSSFPLASASQETIVSNGTLPENWRGVKLDLFANPSHTLKLTIIRHDGTRYPCTSNLNSPKSYVFRGRDQGQGTESHWQLVEHLMEIRKEYDYKISKVGKPRKGGSLKDFVAMIYQIDNKWIVDLVYENKIWNFKLDKETSEQFRKKNGVASGYFGITGMSKPWQDPKELGI